MKNSGVRSKKLVKRVKRPRRIAYLGPRGTYSYKMARLRFPHGQLISCECIRDVFNMLKENRVDYALVPIENSSGGTIMDTVDELVSPDFPGVKIK